MKCDNRSNDTVASRILTRRSHRPPAIQLHFLEQKPQPCRADARDIKPNASNVEKHPHACVKPCYDIVSWRSEGAG
jgi:hypothetical protein